MLPEHLPFQPVDQVNQGEEIKITEVIGGKSMRDEFQAVDPPHEITDEMPLFPLKVFVAERRVKVAPDSIEKPSGEFFRARCVSPDHCIGHPAEGVIATPELIMDKLLLIELAKEVA